MNTKTLSPALSSRDREEYAVDGLVPSEVLFPASADQLAAHVRRAAEAGQAIIPRGGGTMMRLGGVPRSADAVLCTTEMSRVLEYEPADLVVSVEAGIRLAELQRVLGERGQFLALDPPLPDRATIGGIIAANSSGPLRLRHGTCRDMLIGIKVVLADGTLTKSGGKVVKNVTGYDMGKLYTGSLGTLGVIVEASFKVAPLPAIESSVLAAFDSVQAAWEAARAIYKSGLPIRACEMLSGTRNTEQRTQRSEVRSQKLRAATPGDSSLNAQNDKWRAGDSLRSAEEQGSLQGGTRQQVTGNSEADSGGVVLAVWLGGGQSAVDRQVGDVTSMCSKAETRTIEGEEQRGFWHSLEDFGRTDYDTIAKICVLPSVTGELLGRLPSDATFVSHALSGITYVFGQGPEDLQPMVQELGGYLVLEACPLEVKQRASVWGEPGPDFKLMQRIKQEFDPNGILNPGRYVGGI